MTHYREILWLTALGCSQREICASASVSQKTVVKVQKRASELGLNWPLDVSFTNGLLEQRLVCPVWQRREPAGRLPAGQDKVRRLQDQIQAVDESHDRSMRELYGLKPEESQ